MKFVPNPRFAADLRRDRDNRRQLVDRAQDVADRAEQLGRQVADSYVVDVDDSDENGNVRVEADTGDGQHIDAAAWIEFGTGEPGPTPAYAPLRRAAQAEGFALK